MNFFFVLDEGGHFKISPFPEWDKPAGTKIRVLIPGYSLAAIQKMLWHVLKGWDKKSKDKGFIRNRSQECYSEEEFLDRLSCIKEFKDYKWQWEERYTSWPENMSVIQPDFDSYVKGRQLLEGEFNILAKELGIKPEDAFLQAHQTVLRNEAEWMPAVSRTRAGWLCCRCGETELEEWPGIHGMEATCRCCESLGISSSLKVMYRNFNLSADEKKDVDYKPLWELTQAQAEAGRQVMDFVRGETHRALLWAACGAGKTEVCFPAAAWALEQGKTVLFAAPRQDVIHDVAPRIYGNFPGLKTAVLSGATSEKFNQGRMVLATTHQVLRFYQAFDLIFLDEIDAYPYRGNQMLKRGLLQALRPNGKILYLTATPSQDELEKAKRGDSQLIRLPARHHRKPLPVPQWIKVSTNKEFNDCPSVLERCIKTASGSLGTIIFFVPKISMVKEWVKKLSKWFADWKIEGSYSSDPGRRGKMKNLVRGEYRIFVSTSILERGVTIPGAQVIVWEADHVLFDERGLVQMAGRAGRTKDNPTGQVFFLSSRRTGAIKLSIRWIQEQNEIAKNQGLVDEF